MAVELDRETYQQIYDEIEYVDEERQKDNAALRAEIASLQKMVQSLEKRFSKIESLAKAGTVRK